MRQTRQGSSSMAISVVLHLLILLILAFFYANPQEQTIWHEFEWFSDDLSVADLPAEISREEEENQAQAREGEQQRAPMATENTEAPATPSTLIEAPVIDDNELHNHPGNAIDIPHTAYTVPGVNSATDSGSSYNSSLVSGSAEAYIIRQNPPRISAIMDDEVLFDFKLAESGKVIMSSVSVISYRQSAHWEAIRREMPSWRFGFKGRYNSERVYRMRVVFKVN
ncbi:MAG TPA: hypothetical protein PLI73_01470 [Candidatus Cloacimonadota bacterium]|nr:hypothetical protein [Candidatus Cloacimonadota bacterium]